MSVDHQKYPCCGYEHRWVPGLGYWVGMGSVRCRFASFEQLEDVRVGQAPHAILRMGYEEYQAWKKEHVTLGVELLSNTLEDRRSS